MNRFFKTAALLFAMVALTCAASAKAQDSVKYDDLADPSYNSFNVSNVGLVVLKQATSTFLWVNPNGMLADWEYADVAEFSQWFVDPSVKWDDVYVTSSCDFTLKEVYQAATGKKVKGGKYNALVTVDENGWMTVDGDISHYVLAAFTQVAVNNPDAVVIKQANGAVVWVDPDGDLAKEIADAIAEGVWETDENGEQVWREYTEEEADEIARDIIEEYVTGENGDHSTNSWKDGWDYTYEDEFSLGDFLEKANGNENVYSATVEVVTDPVTGEKTVVITGDYSHTVEIFK